MVAVVRMLVAAVATTVVTAFVTSGSAHATTPNGPAASSVVDGSANCWATVGRATLTTSTNAHTGSAAPFAHGIGEPWQEFELGLARTDDCTTAVRPGHAYSFTFFYRAPLLVHPRVYVYRPSAGWKRWFTAPAQPGSSTWREVTVATPDTMDGATRLALALWSSADGDASIDDVTATDLGSLPPVAEPRFRAVFPQTATIIVNEYSHWNADHPDAIRSTMWDMTSGSLFAADGRGYSGAVTVGRPDAHSTTSTNSAIFRLNTMSFAYRDIAVDFDLRLEAMTSTALTPPQDWDGVDIWLRYQSQLHLYDAELHRRDGDITIKKKCPGGTQNGGTYHDLGRASGHPLALGAWTPVGAAIRTNVDGSVTITVYRDGRVLLTADDTGVGCPAITAAGAVGIRADNTEFSFRDFVVTEPVGL